jgi:hypothetical protein
MEGGPSGGLVTGGGWVLTAAWTGLGQRGGVEWTAAEGVAMPPVVESNISKYEWQSYAMPAHRG